ncbi:MAG: hypothetical protein MUO68_15780 [Desulfobacteraceae bacterium]|nr:hypothetical protein [Desulfobacteraceae bacterium]
MQKRYLKHMLRPACIDAPGVLHHIVIREIEQRGIFEEDKDLEDFLDGSQGSFRRLLRPQPGNAKKDGTNDPDLIAAAGMMLRPLEPEINQHNVPILISVVDKTVVYNSKFQIR